MDLYLWLCCKYDRMKLFFALTLTRGETSTVQIAVTDWHQSICPFCSVQVRDYSGTYTVKLIPCTTAQNMEYTVPPVCSPREPVTFDLDIRFQQVRRSLFGITDHTIQKCHVCCRKTFLFSLLSFALSLSLFLHLLSASFSRWVTQLQWSSVWTLRCSCCPRGACGSLMAQWVLVRKVT